MNRKSNSREIDAVGKLGIPPAPKTNGNSVTPDALRGNHSPMPPIVQKEYNRLLKKHPQTKLNIEIEKEELQEILFKRLELKYQGQLKRLQKKMVDLENLVFSWVRKDRDDIDLIKKSLNIK